MSGATGLCAEPKCTCRVSHVRRTQTDTVTTFTSSRLASPSEGERDVLTRLIFLIGLLRLPANDAVQLRVVDRSALVDVKPIE